MTESNVTSFDYHRKTMGQLQRIVEEQQLELKRLREYNDWQDMIIDTMEIQFTEFKKEHEFMVNNILEGLRATNKMIMTLSNKGVNNDETAAKGSD